MELTPHIEAALMCIRCGSGFERAAGAYTCRSCGANVEQRGGQVFFAVEPDASRVERSDDLVFRIKNHLKQHHPRLFFAFYNLAALFVGRKPQHLIQDMSADSVILNIGSGAKRVSPRVVNVDIVPEQHVDIVASVYQLPFCDSSVDCVITESLLEHLEHPVAAVREMRRILKPGGTIYILTPFMLGFHSSPNDFYRWTLPGMRLLLDGFDIRESGVAIGPSSALAAMLREWLAILLSFNSRVLYQIWTMVFMVLLIPLNWIDLLIARYATASQIALAYYWIGKKR